MQNVSKFIGHFINGQNYVDNGTKIDLYSPCNGELIGIISSASDETIDKAIKSSETAFYIWKKTPLSKRTNILFKYKSLLEKNLDKLADLVSLDLGKVKDDAIAEVRRGIENVEYACGVGEILKGEHNKNISSSIDSWSEFEPLGITVGITPFNFPVMVPLWMFPLAIAAGNSFILKPSEKDPLATMYLAELFYEAGLPEGVLNIVNGNKNVVEKLLVDKRIKGVSFVGSTPVAKKIYETSTANGKRCQALGGAKNHALVLSDANIDNAISQIIGAAYGSSGQRCMALSVAVVVKDVKEKFLEKLQNEIKKLKVGLDLNNSNSFGPLISNAHREKVKECIKISDEEGAKIVLDGRNVINQKNSKKGYYLGPTLIDNVKTSMKSYKEEIFGPVLQIIECNDFTEGIEIINKNPYGNGCAIFTGNGEAAKKFVDGVNIGMVGVNIPLPVPSSFHSFGGWKDSFFGDLSIYGPDGLRFYTQRKTVTQRWPSSDTANTTIKFSMPTN